MPAQSVSTTRLAAGSFLFRTAHNDHVWIASAQREAEQLAVVLGRHLAPFSPGSASSMSSRAPDAMKAAAVGSARTFLIDCDTAILAQVPSVRDELPNPRVVQMACAQVLDLPVSPLSFAAPGAVAAFTRAVVGGQRDVWAVMAPYFQFSSPADRWLDINLELLAETIRIAGGREVVTVIQVPVNALTERTVGVAAGRYAEAGARLCLLRVAGFDAEEAGVPMVGGYLAASRAMQDAGLAVVADAVGRFGAVAIAAGATGFSSGLRDYRTVPERPIYDDERFTSGKTQYESATDWFGVPHDKVATMRRAGWLAACPVPGCDARWRGASARRTAARHT